MIVLYESTHKGPIGIGVPGSDAGLGLQGTSGGKSRRHVRPERSWKLLGLPGVAQRSIQAHGSWVDGPRGLAEPGKHVRREGGVVIQSVDRPLWHWSRPSRRPSCGSSSANRAPRSGRARRLQNEVNHWELSWWGQRQTGLYDHSGRA